MNLIVIEPSELDANGLAVLRDNRARHIREVLGAKTDDLIRVGLLDGPFGSGIVREIRGDDVFLTCDFGGNVPPLPAVDLLLAMPRPKVMKRLWAQLAALGVGEIIITNAARVEKNYFDTHVLEESFFRPLLIEGLQQARDTRLPRVSIHRRFRPLVEDELASLSDATERIVADPSGTERIGRIAAQNAGRVLLAVGPEGGWVPFELDLLAKHKFIACGMGTRTLRTDTACIALLAVLHDAMRAGA
jgi:RsmE family RNA methyltransferase